MIQNARERARVEQRLFFEMGTLHKTYTDLVIPKVFGGVKELPNEEAVLEKFKV